ncbi:hypothetical protein LSAT2_028990 [Lamellibrachia satsuma]|nr:hypothetical protein LSAT2_028990 [Lamellibrachia satsuma]
MGDEVKSSGNNTKTKKASLRNRMKKHNDSKAHQAAIRTLELRAKETWNTCSSQGWSLEDGQLGPYCFSCLLLLSAIDGDWSEKEEFNSAMNSLDNSLEYVLAPTISYLQRHHSRPFTSLIKCH